jgi:hypothetical protein
MAFSQPSLFTGFLRALLGVFSDCFENPVPDGAGCDE